MIHRDTLTLEWIEKFSRANRNADKILVEKVIRALLLLEGLSNIGLQFVFKGGTALMLLLNSAKRLSIDIDIILSDPLKDLDQLLQMVAEKHDFNKVELQHRATTSDIEKAHYKFFYTPMHKMQTGDDYVLLDILFEANHYTNISSVPLQSKFIINEGEPAQINIPSLEDLLGDKLTAFAPHTTGIPYLRNENSMTMEINKQLYDIGNLVDAVADVAVIKATYLNIVKTEIAYRKLEGATPADVLEDTYLTALCITTRGDDGKGDFPALLKGMESVRGFIFSENFHLEKAITFAAKAAYMSQLIAANATEIEKFTDPKQIAEAVIQQPQNTKLNKLKKTNPEAFFYWWKATELRNQ